MIKENSQVSLGPPQHPPMLIPGADGSLPSNSYWQKEQGICAAAQAWKSKRNFEELLISLHLTWVRGFSGLAWQTTFCAPRLLPPRPAPAFFDIETHVAQDVFNLAM